MGELDFRKLSVVSIFILIGIIVWTYISSPLIITVNGVGQVSVPATNATLSATVLVNSGTPNGAIEVVKARTNDIKKALVTSGVSEEEIAQSQITTVPAVLVNKDSTGFQSTVVIGAKTTHVADVANLVAELYSAGATVVSQPLLSVENQEKLEQQAFDEALKDAKSQATKLALKNWKFIKKIILISQSSTPSTSTATVKADAITESKSDVAAQNGVFKIAKSVTVSFKVW